MKFRSYPAVLDFLYHNLPMFQRQGAPAMKKDLSNIMKLCDHLGNPQDQFTAIHVAGTNGKGSTCHILSALLQSQGYTVGLYSSPHYKDFRERIKINNQLISKDFIITFINDNLEIINAIKPSFFEITVALAFKYFANQNPDFVIVEVGLGGRLDSTNIITPLLSIITNISKDHVQFLGDTLPLIASEKAGIIKHNVPVIIGEKQKETIPVFEEKAESMGSQLWYAEEQVNIIVDEDRIELAYAQKKITCRLDWFSDYQVYNLRTAWAAFSYVMDGKIQLLKASKFLEQMPQKTYFLGRWMQLAERPTIIAESAHNAAGLKIVMKKLSSLSYNKLFMVMGFSSDKDLASVIDLFPSHAQYLWAKANIPRGMHAPYLETFARIHGLKGKSYSSVRRAFAAAKKMAGKDDLIYIGGSIFVVAEVL